MRTIKFIHDRETKNRKVLFEALVVNAFPNSNQKPFFATVYREPFRNNGWDIYDPVKEYKRLVCFVICKQMISQFLGCTK